MDLSLFQGLPPELQQLLLGAGGDFVGGMAAEVVKQLVGAASYSIRKALRPEPKQQALNLAMTEALYLTADELSHSQDEIVHFLGLFGRWLEEDEVAGELSQVVDPRPDVEIDLTLLEEKFEEIGFAPELLGEGAAFEDVVAVFIQAFYTAAASQPELQDAIKIGLLRGIAGHMQELAGHAHRQVKQGERQTEFLKRMADRVDPDLQPLLQNYLRRILSHCEFLPLRGVDLKTADAATGEDERMRLSDVYVDLDTTTSTEEETRRDNRPERSRPLPVLEALTRSPRLVLLGDPGSGKSTFVSYLAFCLAAHRLAPGEGWSQKLTGWSEAQQRLLPVPIVLRELAAWIHAAESEQRGVGLFQAYLAHLLGQWGLDGIHAYLCEELRNGEALLLLDGLDEIPVDDALRSRINAMIEDLPAAYADTPVLVTCRVLSYQEPRRRLNSRDWPTFEIAGLDDAKIDAFIVAWYDQLAEINVVQNASALSGKLSRAVRRPDLWRLAPNPLLLTVMALVHTHKGELPDARALLYEDVVDLLLWRWEAIKLQSEDGRETTWRQILQEADLRDIDLKRALWEVAFEAHGGLHADDGDDATADIAVSTLLASLRELHSERSLDWAEGLVEIMRLRAGLLIEGRPNVYSFPHRTFEEYLAGCHLSNLPDFTERAVVLAGQGAFWWQVIGLAVGRLVHLAGDIDKPLMLVGELCPDRMPRPDDLDAWRKAWLAGQCLLEVGLVRAGRRELGVTLIERVRRQLHTLLTSGYLEPRERAEAGTVLGAMGDPRDLDKLVSVPTGPFRMGGDQYLDEKPVHDVTVDAFEIGKYPVTNDQYAHFVEATSHRSPPHWRGPKPPPELLNHPVVNVSWHDARAYCRWLSEVEGKTYRLPSEAEWEKAARGEDGREYPWGDRFDAARCNMSRTGIGDTSPVGMFPAGASPYGCLDMAGNVFEWTSSIRESYPYDPTDGREDPKGGRARTLRGGSFNFTEYFVRCADRHIGLGPSGGDDWVGFRVAVPQLLDSE